MKRTYIPMILMYAVFGMLFPVSATILVLFLSGLKLTFSNVLFVQFSEPLLWLINSAPIVVGALGAYAEYKKEMLRQINLHLEENVHLRTVELEMRNGKLQEEIQLRKKVERQMFKAKEEAEVSNNAKTQFLSNMSHEIRTPMNAVIGMTHLILQDEPREDQKENLNILKFSAENLMAIINDILDYNKIEAGKIDLEEINFQLLDLVKAIRKSHQYSAEEKFVELKIDYDLNVPSYIIGDPVRMTQILNNLVSNAVKFTEKGSVNIEVKLENQNDLFSYLNFVVKDSGIGIAPENIEHIFDSFSQADSNTTRKYGGTGLGLPICKKLIELQGSELKIDSTLGKGTTFSFTVAFKRSEKVSGLIGQLHQDIREENHLKGVRILLVEDNLINQRVAEKFLSKWFVELEMANNGKEALELLNKNYYDVVLMDLQMPVMDGFEAAKRIRNSSNEQIKNIPIIALSASVLSNVQERIKDHGMDDYVPKPFNPIDLFEKISKYVNHDVQKRA